MIGIADNVTADAESVANVAESVPDIVRNVPGVVDVVQNVVPNVADADQVQADTDQECHETLRKLKFNTGIYSEMYLRKIFYRSGLTIYVEQTHQNYWIAWTEKTKNKEIETKTIATGEFEGVAKKIERYIDFVTKGRR